MHEAAAGMDAAGRGARARARLWLLGLAVLAAMTLACAPAALADTASISFLDANGHSDPVAGIGRAAVLSGRTSAPERVFIRYRAPGGAPCAPSASSDAGSEYFQGSWGGDTFNDTSVNGDFRLTKTGSWDTPGSFMFCIWLAPDETSVATPIRQDVTFRLPTGAISAAVVPSSPAPNEPVTVTVSGSSEAPKLVYATVRKAGGSPCAVSYDADSGHSLIDGTSVDGSFSLQATQTESDPGEYLICMWLADSSSDDAPVAGPQVATFTVQTPCVVPKLRAGTLFATVASRLTAAHCTLGTTRYQASTKARRGTLVHLSPRGGRTLGPEAPVTVVLSTGRPCVVPAVPRGRSLTVARRLLRASGCRSGRVHLVRSKRRVGKVVGFAPRSGRRLPSRARVDIRVSRGHR